ATCGRRRGAGVGYTQPAPAARAPISSDLEPERRADARWPGVDVEPVPLEQRERDAFHPEAHTRGVRGSPALERDAERVPEVILVVVARDEGRRFFLRADRHEELELERLVALIGREHSAGAS